MVRKVLKKMYNGGKSTNVHKSRHDVRGNGLFLVFPPSSLIPRSVRPKVVRTPA